MLQLPLEFEAKVGNIFFSLKKLHDKNPLILMVGVICTAGLAKTAMGLAKILGTRTEICKSPGLVNIEDEGKPCMACKSDTNSTLCNSTLGKHCMVERGPVVGVLVSYLSEKNAGS